jgi:hypothetical protein
LFGRLLLLCHHVTFQGNRSKRAQRVCCVLFRSSRAARAIRSAIPAPHPPATAS